MDKPMTPQERAAALFRKLDEGLYYMREGSKSHQEQDQFGVELLLEYAQETRRAALLEAAQRADLGDCNSLLDAPCLWCGYNGEGYWQPTTHEPTCPWHNVGGRFDRVVALDRLAQEGALSIDLSPTIQDDGGYGEHF